MGCDVSCSNAETRDGDSSGFFHNASNFIKSNNNAQHRLVLPADILKPYKHSTVGNMFKNANIEYLNSWDKENNTIKITGDVDTTFSIDPNEYNETGNVNPFTLNNDYYFINDTILKQIIKNKEQLKKQLQNEFMYLLDNNPEVKIANIIWNKYKDYINKNELLNDTTYNIFNLYNINFGNFLVMNPNNTTLKYKNFFGESIYKYVDDDNNLSRYQDTNDKKLFGNYYDYFSNIFASPNIYTIKKHENTNHAIVFELPTQGLEFLMFIYENYTSDKYSVYNRDLSELITSTEVYDKNLIILSETQIDATTFKDDVSKASFAQNYNMSNPHVFKFPCLSIKRSKNKCFNITFEPKPLYLYYNTKRCDVLKNNNYISISLRNNV